MSRKGYSTYRRKKTSKPRVDRAAQQAEEFRKENLDAAAIAKKIKALDEEIKQRQLDEEWHARVLDNLNAQLSDHMETESYVARRETIEKQSREIWAIESTITEFPSLIVGVIVFLSLVFGAPTGHPSQRPIVLIVPALCGLFYLFRKVKNRKKIKSVKDLRKVRDRLSDEEKAGIVPFTRKIADQQRKIDEVRENTQDELNDKKFVRKAWRRLQKEIEDQERERRRKEKQEQVKAQADAYRGDIREQSETIKRRLMVTQDCPYCGEKLGNDYHADHIYPVSKGGLSTTRNMVNVCQSCNQKKAGLTLRQFCEKCDLDESEVAEHLNALGKEY
jgi:5-methylcytosine-specific restriction endonuclease McrA